MTLIEAAKMALEYGSFPPGGGIVREIRQAIEEAERQDGPINDGWQITVAHGHSGYGVYAHMEDYPEEGAVLVHAIEQQEPVAWDWVSLTSEAQEIVHSKALWKRFIDGTPLANDIACWMAEFALDHTAPPKREWQGLTEQEFLEACQIAERGNYLVAFQRIQAKLKEKNT